MWSAARRKAIEAELAEGRIPDWLESDYRAMLAEIDRQAEVMSLAHAFIVGVCGELWDDIGAEGKPSQEQLARAQGVQMLVDALTPKES